MTPAEHLAEAERLLIYAGIQGQNQESSLVVANMAVAQAHILAAIAVELGAPHPQQPQGADGG